MSNHELKASHEDDMLNQSSATWRHSNIKYTFPRSHRFQERINVNHSMYNLNSPSSEKACGIGFGDKYYIPIWERKKMRELPGPNRYGSFEKSARSTRRSFSKSNRFLRREDGLPGPGTYQPSHSLYAKGITIKGRLPDGIIKPHPSPVDYQPKDPHATVARGITMKVKWRDIRVVPTPGPGSYQVSNWPRTAKGRRKIIYQPLVD